MMSRGSDNGAERKTVIAHPGSRRPRIEEDVFGVLHVYVMEPAIDGRANEAITRALAERFGVRRAGVILRSGHRSKKKIFTIVG